MTKNNCNILHIIKIMLIYQALKKHKAGKIPENKELNKLLSLNCSLNVEQIQWDLI